MDFSEIDFISCNFRSHNNFFVFFCLFISACGACATNNNNNKKKRKWAKERKQKLTQYWKSLSHRGRKHINSLVVFFFFGKFFFLFTFFVPGRIRRRPKTPGVARSIYLTSLSTSLSSIIIIITISKNVGICGWHLNGLHSEQKQQQQQQSQQGWVLGTPSKHNHRFIIINIICNVENKFQFLLKMISQKKQTFPPISRTGGRDQFNWKFKKSFTFFSN